MLACLLEGQIETREDSNTFGEPCRDVIICYHCCNSHSLCPLLGGLLIFQLFAVESSTLEHIQKELNAPGYAHGGPTRNLLQHAGERPTRTWRHNLTGYILPNIVANIIFTWSFSMRIC